MDAARVPLIGEYETLGRLTITAVPIPHDCTDGFLAAYWRRPDAYLDPTVRANMSAFAFLQTGEVQAGVARLRSDLTSGRWQQCHGAVMEKLEIDFGYRIITAELANA